MYAVIRDGGKQYKVSEGLELAVAYRDAEPGARIEFGDVVCFNDNDGTRIGTPTVPGAKVVAEVLGPEKGQKIYVQRMRRRKDSRRRTGHRQAYLRVQVKEIVAPTAETSVPSSETQ